MLYTIPNSRILLNVSFKISYISLINKLIYFIIQAEYLVQKLGLVIQRHSSDQAINFQAFIYELTQSTSLCTVQNLQSALNVWERLYILSLWT